MRAFMFFLFRSQFDILNAKTEAGEGAWKAIMQTEPPAINLQIREKIEEKKPEGLSASGSAFLVH